MKKVLLATAAVILMTGCSQNEEFENQTKDAEISFISVVGKAARAADTENSNFLEFTVNSYITTGDYDGKASLGTEYMKNISYARVTDALPWTTLDQGTYYWPSTDSGKKVQFFAYPSGSATDYSATIAGYPSISFEVLDVAANQKDLVVAHVANMTSSNAKVSAGTLTLPFTHVLTRINFAYSSPDASITYDVTNISISDVKGGKATYKYGDVDGNGWDLTPSTVIDKSYNYDITQAKTKVEGKDYYSLAGTSSWMLLPQAVNGKVITVAYSTKQGELEIFKGTKTVTLPADAAWVSGKNVLYILTLPVGGEKIKLDTSVSPWETGAEKPETAV